MKILYCANDSFGSYLQLKRVLPNISNGNDVRIAGYTDSLSGIEADYTLDAVCRFHGKSHERYSIPNRNAMQQYCAEIKTFSPDLIINDFDYFSARMANQLDIPYWVVSPSLLYNSMEYGLKKQLKIGAHYRELFLQFIISPYNKFIIEQADKLLVYSYFCDIPMSPVLNECYEWCRPYTTFSNKESEPMFAATLSASDKTYIEWLSGLGSVNLFSPFSYEQFKGIVHHDVTGPEYDDGISNCYLAISRGETTLTADAFYNGKYSLMFPDPFNPETLMNSYMSAYFGLGEILYTRKNYRQINKLAEKDVQFETFPNNKVMSLHQLIEAKYETNRLL